MANVALITGCSTGIGRETARAFLEDGWTVYATTRDERDLRGLADSGAKTATVDVTSEADVTAAVGRLIEEEGHIDCLVNNAGYGQLGPVEDVPTERVARQFNVNVLGPHRLVRAVLPHMRARNSGRIVNVSSAVDRVVLPGTGIYSASKFALRAISDALRQELYGSGINVVVVEPWLVETDFHWRAVEEIRRIDRSPSYDDLYRLLESIESLDRDDLTVGDPAEIGRAIRRAATVEEPKAYYWVGAWAKLGIVASLLLTGRRRDRAARLAVDFLSREGVLDRLR